VQEEVGNIVAFIIPERIGGPLAGASSHRHRNPSRQSIRLVGDVLASVHALGSGVLVVYALLEEPGRHIEAGSSSCLEVSALEPVAYDAAGERGYPYDEALAVGSGPDRPVRKTRDLQDMGRVVVAFSGGVTTPAPGGGGGMPG
jgi:hypothetical protein